mgnify:FL=1
MPVLTNIPNICFIVVYYTHSCVHTLITTAQPSTLSTSSGVDDVTSPVPLLSDVAIALIAILALVVIAVAVVLVVYFICKRKAHKSPEETDNQRSKYSCATFDSQVLTVALVQGLSKKDRSDLFL